MLYVEPNATVAPVVAFIEAAETQLLINNYYIDDAHILQAISGDVHRGVKVCVVVAGNPYRLSQNVSREAAALQQAGAVVKFAPSQFESAWGHRSFDHAKYAVAANEALIGTANWDRSAFSRNREYIYISSDPVLLQSLTSIFAADFNGSEAADMSSIDPDLVISPGSESQLAAAIRQPGAVGVETEELGTDRGILEALEAKGADADVIILTKGARARVLGALQDAGVNVRILDEPYMHAKMVVGQQVGFIGSENFTVTSLDYNREIGILLYDQSELQTLLAVFQQDWASAR
jgi:cardiolipin synthase